VNKRMKQLRALSNEDLKKELTESRAALFRESRRSKSKSSRGVKAPHPMFFRHHKRRIARILTVLTERGVPCS